MISLSLSLLIVYVIILNSVKHTQKQQKYLFRNSANVSPQGIIICKVWYVLHSYTQFIQLILQLFYLGQLWSSTSLSVLDGSILHCFSCWGIFFQPKAMSKPFQSPFLDFSRPRYYSCSPIYFFVADYLWVFHV